MKKVSGGLTYYYIYSQEMTGVVKLQVRLHDFVSVEKLEHAVQCALEVHREFKKKIVRHENSIYYEENNNPVKVFSSDWGYSIIKDTNEYLFGVSGENNFITVSMFHMLTDGRGLFSFIKTILYYYISANYASDQLITDALNAQLGECEYSGYDVDAYERILEKKEKKAVLEEITFSQIGQEHEKEKFIVISLDNHMLKKMANDWGTRNYTVINVILGNVIQDYIGRNKEIAAYMPVDARKIVDAENSAYQILSFINVPHVQRENVESLESQCKKYQDTLQTYKDKDIIKGRLYEDAKLIQLLQRDKVSIESKRIMLSKLFHATVEHRGTFGMSVIAFLREREPLTKYVEDCVFCSPSSGMGIMCEMTQVGEKMKLNIRYRESLEPIILQMVDKLEEISCLTDWCFYDIINNYVELP